MGRKAGSLHISQKNFGALAKPCMKEMIAFLNCLALNQNNDEKCVRHKDTLNACMDAQAGKTGSPGEALIITCKGLTEGGSNLISTEELSDPSSLILWF